jgi:hypothetical protein
MLNLHRALGFHPALRDKLARGEMGKLLVGYDTRNRDTALRAFSALPDSLDATTLSLENTAPDDIAAALTQADLFVLLYDSSCLPTPSPSGPPFLAAIRPAIVEHWNKSVLFKDYGPHLDEAFAESLDDIAARSARLIKRPRTHRRSISSTRPATGSAVRLRRTRNGRASTAWATSTSCPARSRRTSPTSTARSCSAARSSAPCRSRSNTAWPSGSRRCTCATA